MFLDTDEGSWIIIINNHYITWTQMGWTPFHTAARFGQVAAVKTISSMGDALSLSLSLSRPLSLARISSWVMLSISLPTRPPSLSLYYCVSASF